MRDIKGVREVGEVWTGVQYEFSVPKFEDRFRIVKECARLFARRKGYSMNRRPPFIAR